MKVSLENITKEFSGKNRTVKAVDNLSVTLESGKLVGFLGPSGCGKSTTLYMLAGIYDVNKGKIFFDDKDVTKVLPENRNIGMVFQNYALYPHLTVKENIEFPLVNSPKMKKEIKSQLTEGKSQLTFKEFVEQRVSEVAKLVEIMEYLDRKPSELSGGQQQRVAIARALVKRPSLLLLDEPLSNLDARLRLQTREEIRKIQKDTGITTIFVTHDQEEALNICDKIVIMKDGIFQQQGTPQQVYDEPVNLFTARFLGASPINLLDGEVRDHILYIAGKAWKRLPGKGLADQKVKIGIRAENIFITEDFEEELLTVTVTETTRLGDVKKAKVSLENDQIISIFQENRKNLSVGNRIKIGVLPNAIIVFGEDERRLMQW